jgi:hypothetical protein
MKWQTPALDYVARKNLYFSRPPIPSQNFETFCKDREISLSTGQLERLDQTGFLNLSVAINVKKLSLKLSKLLRASRIWGSLRTVSSGPE